jgi:type II secretory pathway component PulJ
MNRFARTRLFLPVSRRRGYTLVEILVATTLSLMILGAVVQLFGTVGTSITQSRSILESAERLRAVQNRLQADLEGLTVTPMPPRKPEFNEGYLEIIEGPMLQGQQGTFSVNYSSTPPTLIDPIPKPVDSDKANALDTSTGDLDDILMFTTRSNGKPFTGKFLSAGFTAPIAVESQVAEVAWFVRGNVLYRRKLLVAPQLFQPKTAIEFLANNDLAAVPPGMTAINPLAQGFFANNDISVRRIGIAGLDKVTPNTLADLTRRECRFAHPTNVAAYDVRYWSYLGLPTAKETSDPTFVAGIWDITRVSAGSATPNVMDDFYSKRPDLKNNITGFSGNPYPKFDYWTTNTTARLTDSEIKNSNNTAQTYQGSSVADDVILTNVVGFDVKVWDPGAGQYVDLGKTNVPGFTDNAVTFAGMGASLNTGPGLARVYDTWSTTYDGTQASDGFDNGPIGIVDNDGERAAVPPYTAPLRGIQVKIRIFEPDSRQIREVTVEQDFLPK